jgi:membrane-associated PAP2 superfamily phosphatase
MNNKAKIVILTGVLLLVLVSTSSAGSSTQYAVEWDVVSAGGTPMASSTYGLMGTVGQSAPGGSSSAGYVLCAGYWCGIVADYTIYLPLVLSDT